MSFEKYKRLARKVFPQLPDTFEALPDAVGTYQLVFCFTCPREPADLSQLNDFQRADHFSVSAWTNTKLRELSPRYNR
jgi:hypothetical protein